MIMPYYDYGLHADRRARPRETAQRLPSSIYVVMAIMLMAYIVMAIMVMAYLVVAFVGAAIAAGMSVRYVRKCGRCLAPSIKASPQAWSVMHVRAQLVSALASFSDGSPSKQARTGLAC